MGEVTEMMEEGILCQVCGVFLGDGDTEIENFEGTGTWTSCPSCAE